MMLPPRFLTADITTFAHAQKYLETIRAFTSDCSVVSSKKALSAKAELSFPLAHGLPWFGSDMAIRCGEVHLHLGNTDQARSCVETARTILAAYHDSGRLPERLRRLDDHIRTTAELSLTPAELRLLPFLPTHLTLQEIAERTFRSRATVKSQAASIYTKLGVSSRSEAVTELLRTGLVTSALLSPDEPT